MSAPTLTGQAAVTAFTNVRVIGGTGHPEVENAVIVVRQGRIEAIGPASAVRPPAGARVVDLGGKFAMPGLISAHAHVSDVNGMQPRAYTEANTLRQLGVFARYGVTSVWSLGGEQAPAFKLRDAQQSRRRSTARASGSPVTSSRPRRPTRRASAWPRSRR